MAITYVGVTDFLLQSEYPSGEHHGLPTLEQVWKGAATQFDAFWASKPTGTPHAGGYIVSRNGVNKGMYPEITLRIALPPNFQSVVRVNSSNRETFQKTATLAQFGQFTDVSLERRVSAKVDSTIYKYFSSSSATSPRFTAPVSGANPRILSDRVTANGSTGSGGKVTVYVGGWQTAPTEIREALSFQIENQGELDFCENIPGTPWYECACTARRTFVVEE